MDAFMLKLGKDKFAIVGFSFAIYLIHYAILAVINANIQAYLLPIIMSIPDFIGGFLIVLLVLGIQSANPYCSKNMFKVFASISTIFFLFAIVLFSVYAFTRIGEPERTDLYPSVMTTLASGCWFASMLLYKRKVIDGIGMDKKQRITIFARKDDYPPGQA